MGSVNDLINEKLNDDRPGKAADTRKKFVVFLDESTRVGLDNLAKVTATGKIELASEIFKIAIADATKACIAAGKLNKDGSLPASATKEEKAAKGGDQAPAAQPQ